MATFLLPLGLLISILGITDAQSIGVCYGKKGNNLPSEAEVVSLYQSNNITRMRIYSPDKPTLEALRGSNIELILGAPNKNLQSLADNASTAAATWVRDNVVAYASDVKFKYIAVGNEVHPGDANARYVLPAMQNIQAAITAANLQGRIKVSTAIDTALLENSFPPSSTVFSDTSYIGPIINFLVKNQAPLLANVYTYFSYVNNPQGISLEYALFTSPEVVLADGQFQYQNLFDALMDALYAALEKSGGANLQIVVSESGWPSEGSSAATPANAGTYYKNLINHVKRGTPKKSGQAIETYLFDALMDALYAALEKSGGANLQIVVSESGWPSEGSSAATPANAGTYYKNLINHVKRGTPKKSGQAIETYLFAMFDENLKAAGIEQHFGLFLPNRQNKYQITFGLHSEVQLPLNKGFKKVVIEIDSERAAIYINF